MKKILFITVCLAAIAFSSHAQKYAIIDTKYILSKMPEYVDADKKLQGISDQWQKDIDNMQAQLNDMYKNYDGMNLILHYGDKDFIRGYHQDMNRTWPSIMERL